MSTPDESVRVEVTTRGNVGSFAGDYARERVSSALAVAHGPVLHAHVVLDWRHDPALERPAVAEAGADVDGTRLRAKASAPTMREAVDELEHRLRRRLVQLHERERTLHRATRTAAEHEWRHGDLPRRPLPYFPREEEAREVVRSKSLPAAAMTAGEAAYEMELLDHDFFLYRDAGSGRPALVRRLPDGGYGVQGAGPGESAETVTHEPPPPALTDAEARTRLGAGVEPFVFYLDQETGEGRVLYHRYDGHYGLLVLTA
ncbi:ribosome hibernation promotion factor [Nocardioides sp. Soil805]|uniref:ribosome hibernation promotion factor n=1 Tax=Nocardioides sp. Soil805 TaxID=1736416 RepID=UPI000702D3B1|nr:HPF/RaiA family ribosome-associated protein [Nocardioides sp. Soil805]